MFADALLAEAEENPDIVAITAAMPSGTGLDAFGKRFPERFFDVGICEEHAVTFASGLALGGKLPVVAIYSTFLQRAFDETVINVALQNQHVVFCVDRAGLVGADRPTHHGAFDLAYLRSIPNFKIIAPSSASELASALHTALRLDGPVAIRYPRGATDGSSTTAPEMLPVGESRLLREGSDVALLAVGHMVGRALEVARLLEAEGISARVVDMRWVKPLDVQEVRAAARSTSLVVTIEDGSLIGGFGTAVSEVVAAEGYATKVLPFGLPDRFIQQGDIEELFETVGLAPEQIAAQVVHALPTLMA